MVRAPPRTEFDVALIVLFIILALFGFLLLAGLIALGVWLVRRSQTTNSPTAGSETSAPPQ